MFCFCTAKMSKLYVFREFISEILSTAALEIFGVVEKTLIECNEEISRSEEERKRLQRLLNVVNNPNIADVQHLSLPELPQIKEEQELWTSQEEEQLQGLKSETPDSIFAREPEFSNLKMSKLHMIREFFSERLTAAASEIFGAVEIMVGDYKEEISRSKVENARTQRLFDIVAQPELKLHRTDVQHLSLPEPLHIQEKQELWTSQEEEQLQGLQSETKDSIFTSLSVKHDYDQVGSSECSHLDKIVKMENREGDSLPSNTTEEQIKAEPHVQDYAAPEPDSDSQSLSVVAPDCQRWEEHGGVLPLREKMNSTITQVHSAVPGEKTPKPSHKGVKVHQCQECRKLFTQSGSLARHMRTHTRAKLYLCQECKKGFTSKLQLVEHIRTHTGEKPYQCQECKKCFTQNGSLVKHMRTHSGEKSYKCQHCENRFSRKDHMVEHMRKHTGEKPYQCQECKQFFAQHGSLVKHMRTHTGEKPYPCQLCNRRFSQKSTLGKHMSIHRS